MTSNYYAMTGSYDVNLVVAKYDTEDSAKAACARMAAKFKKLANRLRIEEDDDEWLHRGGWDIVLVNGTNAEGAQIWRFLMGR